MSRNAKGSKQGSNKGSNKGSKGKDVPPVVTQGNIPLTQRMSKKELDASIDSLMDDLRNATERKEKKTHPSHVAHEGTFRGIRDRVRT